MGFQLTTWFLLSLWISIVFTLLITDQKPQTCPHGWLPWRNTCFMLSVGIESWYNAELYCRAVGGYLAEVHDAETNEFLKTHLKATHFNNHSVSYWIGLSDMANVNLWEWTHTKTLPNFKDWQTGQPQQNDEHCVAFMGYTAFTWHDRPCDAKSHFICQENKFVAE